MNRSTPLTRLFGTTVLAGVFGAAFAGHALAQTTTTTTTTTSGQPATAPAAADQNALEEVVVTGTRIRKPSLDTNTPVAVIDQRSIALSGITDVADILQRQPQVGIGSNTNTTTNVVRNQGLETISLRNLGSNRTLTLINGHRQVGGAAGSSAVDINTISPTDIDRIDIVTGGSSALYGADAVAGVVNFILKRDQEGVNYRFQYGDSEHGGGQTYFGSITVGHNFDHNRGNVTLSVDYNNTGGIFRNQRDYAVEGISGVANPARSPTSANVPAIIAIAGVRTNTLGNTFVGNTNFLAPVVATALIGNPANTLSLNAAGNGVVPLNKGTILPNAAGAPSTSSINCPVCFNSTIDTLQTPVEREGFSSTGRYELLQDRGWFRSVEAYYEGKFFHTNGFTAAQEGTFASGGLSLEPQPKASAGLPAAGAGYPIKLDNAYLPASLLALANATPVLPTFQGSRIITITRLDNDFGNREFKTHYDQGEIVAGFRGTFKNNWHFDTFINYGETNSTAVNFDRNELTFFQQIDAVRSPVTGNVVCRSTLTNPNNGCLPLNLFALGVNSPAAVAQSYTHTVEHDQSKLLNYQLNLTGDLFHYSGLFSHTDLPVGFALGYEYRREESSTAPDQLVQSGSAFGNYILPTVGHFDTNEVYGELNVPVLADLPFVKRLEFDFSGRAQDYSTTGFDGTYGVSGNWALTNDFKLRGVYSKAVRAPNINELFAAGSVSFASIADPCDVNNVNLGTFPANRKANCIATLQALGVNPFTGPGGTYGFTQNPSTKATVTNGNQNLAAERATTYTAGFVWTPNFLRGFSVTADYFDIKIQGAIGSLSFGTIVNNCVDAAGPGSPYCQQVTRTPGDGNISLAQGSNFNIAALRTKGEDLSVAYTFDVSDLPMMRGDLGRISLSGSVTHNQDLIIQALATDPTTRTNGAGALTGPEARIQGEGRATWDWKNLTASYAIRYIGALNRSNEDKPLDYSYERIPEFAQHDIRLEYRWRGQAIFFGINNFTDQAPPFTPSTFTGTGAASLYGPVGRFYYTGISGKF